MILAGIAAFFLLPPYFSQNIPQNTIYRKANVCYTRKQREKRSEIKNPFLSAQQGRVELRGTTLLCSVCTSTEPQQIC